jgi:hypothetical protein
MERFAAAGYIYTATQDTLPNWAGNPLSHYGRYHKLDAPFARASFNPEGAGSLMAALLKEAGVTALYNTSFVDVILTDGVGDSTITAIIVENASGRQAITGKVFIEGSGTAHLAAAAGVPFVRGGGPQPDTAAWDGVQRPIPGGLLWIMSNIDFACTVAHQTSAQDPHLSKLIAEADAAGDLPKGLYRPRMRGENVYGDLYIGHPTLDMSPMLADGTFIMWQNVPYEWALRMDESGADDARARRELRGFIDAEARFLRKYVPGFESAVLMDVGRFVGVRDGRHPIGQYVFSIDDARKGHRFRDAVTKPMTRRSTGTSMPNTRLKFRFVVSCRRR